MKTMKLIGFIYLAFMVAACSTPLSPTPSSTSISTIEPVQTISPEPVVTLQKPTSSQQKPINTSQPPTLQPTAAISDCTKGWTKLRIGSSAVVAGAATDLPNRVRSGPNQNDSVTTQIYPGTIVKIIDGPVCEENLVFWKIANAGIPGGTGWTAEGDHSEYWLEPYAYMPDLTTLSAYGVSFSVPGSWASIPNAEKVPAGTDEMCKWPEYIKITLAFYTAQSQWHPVIYVYQTDDMPEWYPLCPGAPLLRVRKQTLLQGDRNLFGSTNAQPIFNSELVYAYKGQVSNGKYTVYAFFPVNFPLLAYSFQDTYLPSGGIPFDLDHQDWSAYYKAVGEQLEAASDYEFTPSLDILDALVESINVTEP